MRGTQTQSGSMKSQLRLRSGKCVFDICHHLSLTCTEHAQYELAIFNQQRRMRAGAHAQSSHVKKVDSSLKQFHSWLIYSAPGVWLLHLFCSCFYMSKKYTVTTCWPAACSARAPCFYASNCFSDNKARHLGISCDQTKLGSSKHDKQVALLATFFTFDWQDIWCRVHSVDNSCNMHAVEDAMPPRPLKCDLN